MALIRRISRLFAADMHAVLDQIEEPESVLKQAIREMEEELARQRQRVKWFQNEIETTRARIEGLETARAELDEKLDLCFANGNEELARKLTRRKLETQQLAEQLSAKRDSLTEKLTELEAVVTSNRDQLEGMRQKAELLVSEHATPGGASDVERCVAIDEDDVEIAFLREKEARARS